MGEIELHENQNHAHASGKSSQRDGDELNQTDKTNRRFWSFWDDGAALNRDFHIKSIFSR